MRECTVAATLLIDVVGYLERNGVPLPKITAALQMDPAILAQPDARVPGSLVERMWTEGARLTGDPHLGLHTAETHNPGTLNILGYVLMSCRSAADALNRLAHYATLLNDGLRIRILHEATATRCVFDAVPIAGNYLARAPRDAMEAMACGTVVTLRKLVPSPMEPTAVTFRHAAPNDTSEHRRIFGACVQFGQPDNAVVFRTADLSADLLSANPGLLRMFEAQANQLLQQLDRRGPVSRRVLDVVARRIVAAAPSLEEIAAELGMSARTIQRELREEETSFRQLVEEVRKELAVQHLSHPDASVTEAAFLAGFSELSAFTRAFRRWTGVPPTQFRSA